jgi:hypothetical protein
VLNQGSAEKTREELKENGRNAKQVVLKQHSNKGLYANWTDTNGNQILEPVRKQAKED